MYTSVRGYTMLLLAILSLQSTTFGQVRRLTPGPMCCDGTVCPNALYDGTSLLDLNLRYQARPQAVPDAYPYSTQPAQPSYLYDGVPMGTLPQTGSPPTAPRYYLAIPPTPTYTCPLEYRPPFIQNSIDIRQPERPRILRGLFRNRTGDGRTTFRFQLHRRLRPERPFHHSSQDSTISGLV
jgi:hypothetical protein